MANELQQWEGKRPTARQIDFAAEYIRNGEDAAAAYRVSYSAPETMAGSELSNRGNQVLQAHGTQTALRKLRGDAVKLAGVSATDLLERAWLIATANPNDIVQHRRVNCRHCWGHDFNYQWIEGEFYEEVEKIVRHNQAYPTMQKELPDGCGGFGYRDNRDPNEHCPRCSGEGESRVYVTDTRDLKGGAALLYDGTKVTKNGIEVQLKDQSKYFDMVCRHFAFYNDTLKVKGAMLHAHVPLTDKQRKMLDRVLDEEY
jgi:phage terminase small subunit